MSENKECDEYGFEEKYECWSKEELINQIHTIESNHKAELYLQISDIINDLKQFPTFTIRNNILEIKHTDLIGLIEKWKVKLKNE